MIGSIIEKNRSTFGGDPVPDTNSGSLFHFPQHCRIGILGDLVAFLVQSLAHFHDSRRNEWLRQGNESLHFGRDPMDTRIQPGNPDSNPGSLLFEATKVQGVRCTWRWRRYDFSECFLVIIRRPRYALHLSVCPSVSCQLFTWKRNNVQTFGEVTHMKINWLRNVRSQGQRSSSLGRKCENRFGFIPSLKSIDSK